MSEQFLSTESFTHRFGSVLGAVAGISVFLTGIVVTILGLIGQIRWVIPSPRLTARITNAEAGLVLALLGILILWRFNPRFWRKELPDRQESAGNHGRSEETRKIG